MNNKEAALTWFEIPVENMDRAVSFYEHIFKIKMQQMDLGDGLQMALFPRAEHTAGGSLIHNPDYYRPSSTHGPLIYLNVDPDLSVAESRVEDAGGAVSIAKRRISPEFGYMAVIEDTEGNRVALFSDS